MSKIADPMPHYLEPIIHPKSIAIIGASRDPAKRGYRAIASLLADEYQGTIYPVNPKEAEILGLQSFRSIDALPAAVDLALVCTASATVPGIIEDCGKAGVKGAVLLAGGFSEASTAGRLLEDEAVAIARRYGLRLIGPNTSGMFSARLGCNALGTLGIPRGNIAILSNSANIMSSLLNETIAQGHSGISIMLSVGNQSDVSFDEYLEFLGADVDTRSIIFYVEGFKDAPAFLRSARTVTAAKPVVMYVAGRNSAGVRAAKSHSGSLAGDHGISRGVLKQAGVVVVSRSDDLFPVAEALAKMPPMKGRRVAILSEGGGPITVASETCEDLGLELAQLTETTQKKISQVVPNATAISNPIDAGGGTDPRPEYYGSISEAVLQDPNIDGLLLVGLFGGYGMRWGDAAGAIEEQVCRRLGELSKAHGKPIMVQSHFAHLKTKSLEVLAAAGIPYQRHIETAVQCLADAATYHASKVRGQARPAERGRRNSRAQAILRTAAAEDRDLLEPEALEILQVYDIRVPEHVVLANEQSAAAVDAPFGDKALAVKVVSPEVLHKSDVGGVKLNIVGAAGVAEAIRAIRGAVSQGAPGARIEGYIVTPMVEQGTELLIGVFEDAIYGRILTFGLGGVFVEVMRDVSFRALPIKADDAREMIDDIRHKKVLEGLRGRPPVNVEKLVDLLMCVSDLASAHDEIREIDLNPVIADAQGCSIVDARIILRAQA